MLSTTSPFSFLLFGASGNLAKLKIYPALYILALKKRLPKDYIVIGFARSAMSKEAFRDLVSESIQKEMGDVTLPVLEEFLTHVHYQQGQYDSLEDFKKLEKHLTEVEKGWSGHVRLAYLSIPPSVINPVVTNLCESKINAHIGDFRCIVEKPVGHDLATFEETKKQLTASLKENEIYLLDHYLGKEAVRNVYYLRLANPILERLFKHTLIQHVEITASEPMGIEERAGYFEHTGTLRDMFQSHLLMMTSLLTMNLHDSDDLLPDARLAALKQIYLPPAAKLDDILLQGQYTAGTINKKSVMGYQDEQGVAPGSRVNTYVALKLMSKDAKWQGVPFYLRSGKRLPKKETRISIQFQQTHIAGKNTTPNRLDIILQGEAGMRICLQTRVGGTEPMYRPLILEDPLVCVGDCLPEHGTLLLEAIHGHTPWYLTFEEIQLAWRLIDPLQAHLSKESTPLHLYAAGTYGPEEAERWIERDGMKWVND